MTAAESTAAERQQPTAAVMAPLLTGDRFRPERYHFFSVLDSTNRQAAQWARAGAPEGTVVVADQQTAGRGRLGRHWSSPAGVNLYCSIVLRPALSPREVAQLTLLTGLVLARTVTGMGVAGVEIKWPNDLLLNGRKLAGILTEARVDSSGVQYVVVGIGINLNGTDALLPPELRGKAIHLAELLRGMVDRPRFLADLLAQFDRGYGCFCQQGFGPLREEWLAFSRLLGRPVQVRMAAESFAGQALALDNEGCLLVQRADGGLTRVVAGDILFAEDE